LNDERLSFAIRQEFIFRKVKGTHALQVDVVADRLGRWRPLIDVNRIDISVVPELEDSGDLVGFQEADLR
jgi:hypothetical protein